MDPVMVIIHKMDIPENKKTGTTAKEKGKELKSKEGKNRQEKTRKKTGEK